jgi:hypothetical protein
MPLQAWAMSDFTRPDEAEHRPDRGDEIEGSGS